MGYKYALNQFHTTDLVLNVMATCAERVGQDINDDEVAEKLYWICCDLESWDDGEGFGSSDHYSYINAARKEFGLTTHQEYQDAMATVARFMAESNFSFTSRDTHKEIDRLAAHFLKEVA